MLHRLGWWMMLALWACPALADGAASFIEVRDASLRLPPPGVAQAAAFLIFENRDEREHALLRIRTAAAQRAEVHTHTHTNGMMRMVAVPRLPIPAHRKVTLAPGGYHVMLFGLRPGLTPGSRVSFQLEFEDGSVKEVEFVVRAGR